MQDPLPKSVTDVANFWKQTAYNINGLTFSLDDIEHGILRGIICAIYCKMCMLFSNK